MVSRTVGWSSWNSMPMPEAPSSFSSLIQATRPATWIGVSRSGDPKVALHEGADLGGRVGLDEDATLVDVGRELTEERVDSAVVDADL